MFTNYLKTRPLNMFYVLRCSAQLYDVFNYEHQMSITTAKAIKS